MTIVGITGFFAVCVTIAIGAVGFCFGLLVARTRPPSSTRWLLSARYVAGPLACSVFGLLMIRYASDHDTDGIAWAFPAGGLLIWLSVEVAIRGVGRRTKRPSSRLGRKRTRAPSADPRWLATSAPQRVGRACVVCKGIIRTEDESVLCDACGSLCHVTCLARHCGTAHAPSKGPFRDDPNTGNA
jgi:hypothetical protein